MMKLCRTLVENPLHHSPKVCLDCNQASKDPNHLCILSHSLMTNIRLFLLTGFFTTFWGLQSYEHPRLVPRVDDKGKVCGTTSRSIHRTRKIPPTTRTVLFKVSAPTKKLLFLWNNIRNCRRSAFLIILP